MPELPEVQTTVNGLNSTVAGLKIVSVWTDYSSSLPQFVGSIKNKVYFKRFKKKVTGQNIKGSTRVAKNIFINLKNGSAIWIHLKMTGHLLLGRYEYDKKSNKWIPKSPEYLKDPFNRFVHLVFELSNGKFLALSDSRKFASIKLIDDDKILKERLRHIGPDPMGSLSVFEFKKILNKKPNGKIKQVLMDQTFVSGIGNIYADETLWEAEIHPESIIKNIPSKKIAKIFSSVKKIMKKSISLGGDSMSDFRNLDGKKGSFQNHHKAYKQTGKPCQKSNCLGKIIRKMLHQRSTHFCPEHQVLYCLPILEVKHSKNSDSKSHRNV